jgi:Ca2+-transporting ATPase
VRGLALVRVGQGHGWLDAIVSAATLAVAALPEEFPVVLAVFLGVGVYRLARRQALVRRAVSVENIGRVSCICSDKTGTVTEGRLRLATCCRLTVCVPLSGCCRWRLPPHARAAGIHLTRQSVRRQSSEACPSKSYGQVMETYPFTEERSRETVVFRRDRGQYVRGDEGNHRRPCWPRWP